MTNKELLEAFRAVVLELCSIENQLSRILPTGQPSGVKAQQYKAEPRGTNDPTAAAMQLYDGLMAQKEEKAAEIARLTKAAWPIIMAANTPRDMLILNHYYMMGMTDQEIARQQGVTREHICRERKAALNFLR